MRTVATAIAVLAAMTMGLTAQDNLAKTAKETSAKYQDCVVHVTATLKIEASGMGMMMGQGNEQKMETIGTIVDPSGLTVVSLSRMDPTSMFAGMSLGGEGENQEISAGSQFSDVKIRLADGTELPAKLIMKEPDLDLAFVIPETADKGKKYTYLDLTDSGTADVLEDLFTLDRFGKVLNYKPAISKMYIIGVVTKPKLIYAVNDASDLGVPAFNAAGKLVGICTLKISQENDRGIMAMATGGGMHPIVMPAADVLDTAKQALAKKDDNKEDKEANKKAKPKK